METRIRFFAAILFSSFLFSVPSLNAQDIAISKSHQYRCIVDSIYSGLIDAVADPILVINKTNSYSMSDLKSLEVKWVMNVTTQQAGTMNVNDLFDANGKMKDVSNSPNLGEKLYFGEAEIQNIKITLKNGESYLVDNVTSISPEMFLFKTLIKGKNGNAILYSKKVDRPFVEINGQKKCSFSLEPSDADSTRWQGIWNKILFEEPTRIQSENNIQAKDSTNVVKQNSKPFGNPKGKKKSNK
jgi:hypothetical protein